MVTSKKRNEAEAVAAEEIIEVTKEERVMDEVGARVTYEKHQNNPRIITAREAKATGTGEEADITDRREPEACHPG